MRLRVSRPAQGPGRAADARDMDAERLVLVRGMAGTSATLARLNGAPWPVLWRWMRLSGGVACGLLLSVLLVAKLSTPDLTPLRLPGVGIPPSAEYVAIIFGRNLLVLALHAMACVAGFMAGASMPQLAAARTGLSRAVHEQAGRFAILFVIAATIFSLCTQAYVLGSITSTVSAHLEMPPGRLL